MSRRRTREEQDDEVEQAEEEAAPLATPKPIPSLFSMELEKRQRALQEQLNAELKHKMTASAVQNQTLDPSGSPGYCFWDHVAEYRRAQREVDLRFGGRVGHVFCFGSNEMFQQGLPDLVDVEDQEIDNMSPHRLGVELRDIRQVRAGGTSLAALDVHGNVYTWGSSDNGVLGRIITGEDEEMDKSQATPTIVKGFVTADGDVEDGKISQIDVGDMHMLYLSTSGNVYFNGSFKDNDSGVFSPPDPKFVVQGRPPEEPPFVKGVDAYQPDTYGILQHKSTPIHIKSLKDIIAVYSGGSFCAVLTKDRQILTFGFGNSGELARSPTMAPPKDNGKYDVTTLFYVNKKQDTYGWKNMDILRNKYLTPAPVQYAVPGKRRVLNLACGGCHLLVVALDEDGKTRLYASGLNNYGQLGLKDTEPCHVLTKVPFFDDNGVTAGQVSAGLHFSLALSHGGDALYSFGRADYGALGRGKFEGLGFAYPNPERVALPPGTIIKQIATGDTIGMATTIDDELYTWGWEGVTGHGGEYLDHDCPYPKHLPVRNINGVHSMDGGTQHGVFLGSWDPTKPGAVKESNEEKAAEPQKKRQKRS